MSYLEIFENELQVHGLTWCKSCDLGNAHKRGFVVEGEKVIHLNRAIATRSTLHRALHEIGHAIHDQKGMRRFEKEEQAETWATNRMRELGVTVPRKVISRGVRYVKRMKRWGDNIRRGRK